MKKLTALFFALVMILSVAFISGSISTTDNSFSAQAQTATTARRKKGVIRRGYAGGKWVTKKVYRGGKWVTMKSWKGGKWVGKKSYKTGRKVVSRSKKILW